jgi:hypothetical protein
MVVQPEPPVAKLRLQDAILFAKEPDHIALLGLTHHSRTFAARAAGARTTADVS